jgi:hypothetical protein
MISDKAISIGPEVQRNASRILMCSRRMFEALDDGHLGKTTTEPRLLHFAHAQRRALEAMPGPFFADRELKDLSCTVISERLTREVFRCAQFSNSSDLMIDKHSRKPTLDRARWLSGVRRCETLLVDSQVVPPLCPEWHIILEARLTVHSVIFLVQF